ncbi:hypothetical protein [Rhizobium sp. RM]|uniref:hypothetical protein n=1 Tax=Rhizobium sp. RM TaxID=2748079 RepID=UPI00110EDE80|nr:hypothetical protein [Rhizobium sp. RM]NWJ27483.1 hypothetical protein [Rhizobium sp. RM]TMV20052.1 hypothetical protein BJG94_11740 [Rhizobium sp. Td3]
MLHIVEELKSAEDGVDAARNAIPLTLTGVGAIIVVGFIGICLDVAVVTVQGWYHAFMAYWPF